MPDLFRLEQGLLAFFEQVARKDEARLCELKREPGFTIEQGRWCFTLPGLYSFLRRQDPAYTRIDYKQFRRLVFGSPIGRSVRSLGAEIVIADNCAMVDQSTYALVWH
ncbi:MAG TPA: hypothetical protein VFY15_02885 [Acidimicrobiia bacterium]|nr:hypothetical protein [Acidimicrobiia bacterium]